MFGTERKKAIAITKDNFDGITTSERIVLIFFEAPWCPACKMVHPIVNDLADENKEKERLTLAFVNVDQERELADTFGIRSIPTLIVYKDGKLLAQGPGMITKPKIQEMIDKLVN